MVTASRRQAGGCAGLADRGHAGADRQLAGDEVGAARRAARLGVVVGEQHAFGGELVEVRRPARHHAAVVGADVPDADVVAHDDDDVRLLLRGRRPPHQGQDGQQHECHNTCCPKSLHRETSCSKSFCPASHRLTPGLSWTSVISSPWCVSFSAAPWRRPTHHGALVLPRTISTSGLIASTTGSASFRLGQPRGFYDLEPASVLHGVETDLRRLLGQFDRGQDTPVLLGAQVSV